eukprot:TRINITY_DN16084_c0_g1_i2.p1 TRINITY_DN16084_c0_g1~~TRINITY_DN16084_c0_g1_i2.p1  ORF type:complete len:202 (-),score=29.72 TRINITY_DN16084_c0_g1_i2:170-775(-)
MKGIMRQAHLAKARALVRACDPKNQIEFGWYTPFLIKLAETALDILGDIIAELDMLLVALVDPPDLNVTPGTCHSDILKPITENPTMDKLRGKLMPSLDKTFNVLKLLLEHKREDLISDPQIEEMQQLSGIDEDLRKAIYSNIVWPLKADRVSLSMKDDGDITAVNRDSHARATVALRSLENAIDLVHQLQIHCMSENIFE